MKKIFFISLMALMVLGLVKTTYAQESNVDSETTGISALTAINDLGTTEPTTLPGDGLNYFFKNLGRTLQETFTFNLEKKTELQLRHASDNLAELQKTLEIKKDDPKLQELLQKTQDKYQNLIDKVGERIDSIQAKDADLAKKLTDKLTEAQLKQQQFLQNLEDNAKNLSADRLEKIKITREKSLERLSQALQTVEQKSEEITQKLEQNLENRKATYEKRLEQLRVLQNLNNILPDGQVKDAFNQAQDTAGNLLIESLRQNPNTENGNNLKERLQNMSEDSAQQLKIMNFIEQKLKERASGQLNSISREINDAAKKELNALKNDLEKTTDETGTRILLKSLQNGDNNSLQILDQIKNTVKNPQVQNAIKETQNNQIETVKEKINSSSEIKHLTEKEVPNRMGDPKQRCPDISRAKSLLVWEPAIGFDEGLNKTIADFKKRLENKPHIAVFTPSFLPLKGPAEEKALEVMEQLVGWEFDIFTARLDKKLEKETHGGRMHIYRLGPGSILDKYFLPIRAALRAKKLNKKYDYQVSWAIMASYGALAATLFSWIVKGSKPMLLSVYEGDITEKMLKKGKMLAPIYRFIFRQAHRWQVIGQMSEQQRAWLEDERKVQAIKIDDDKKLLAKRTKEMFQELEILSTRL